MVQSWGSTFINARSKVFKPGFHIENRRRSGILLFADHPRFCRYIRYSPEVCARFSRNDTFICDRGTGDWNPSPKDADVPDGTNLSFHLSGMIADHRRNLGRVGKIETHPILQICPHPRRSGILLFCRPSQISPIYRIFDISDILSQIFEKRYVYLW